MPIMMEIQRLPEEIVNEWPRSKPKPTEDPGPELMKMRDSIFLYFSSFTVGLTMVSFGCSTVWISPVLPNLQSNDTDLNPLGSPITTFETSTLASMLTLGNVFSPWLIHILLDSQGRKVTLMLLSTLAYLAAALIAFYGNFYAYCIGRGVLGLSLGANLVIASIYISEICEDHNRGKVGVLVCVFKPLGNLYAYWIGPILSVRSFTLLCALPVFLSTIIMGLFLPDSPVHLASIGDDGKALEAIRKLRHKDSQPNAETELINIKNRLKDCHIENEGFLSILLSNYFRKSFIIVLGVMVTANVSGITVIKGFIGPIFNDAQVGITGDQIGMCLALIQIISLIVTSSVTEKLGRRVLLLFSTLGTTVCLSFIGVYFYLLTGNSVKLASIRWIAVSSTILFYISYSFGLSCVPKLLTNEIFPSNIRSMAVSVTSFISSIILCLITFSFPILQREFGNAFCFWSYAVSCFIGFWFIYFFVPETKGKNIMEIPSRKQEMPCSNS